MEVEVVAGGGGRRRRVGWVDGLGDVVVEAERVGAAAPVEIRLRELGRGATAVREKAGRRSPRLRRLVKEDRSVRGEAEHAELWPTLAWVRVERSRGVARLLINGGVIALTMAARVNR